MLKNKIAITLLCVTTFIYTSNIDVRAFHMDKAKKKGFIEQHAEEQMEKHSTKLKKEIEIALNQEEVFDEELETLTDQEMEQINEAEEVHAITSYYKIIDDDAIEVSKEDINECLEEKKSDKNRFHWLNFGAKKAQAKTREGKYMKASLTYCEYSKYVMVYGHNTWITQPKNRYNDFYGIALEQNACRFDLDSQEATYTYKYKDVYEDNNKVLRSETITKKITPKTSKHIEYLSNMGSASPKFVGARVNLKNNLYEAVTNLVHTQTVTAQTCSIKAKMLKRDSKYVDFVSFYRHGNKSYNGSDLSVGLSLSLGGPEISVTYTPNSRNVSDYWSKQTNVELSIDKYVC